MCFSPEVSLGTFIIGIVGALLAFSLGTITDKIVGLFFGFVSCMQGIELALWKNQTCNTVNRNISLLGMIFNHLQPVVLAVLIVLLNKDLSESSRKIIIISTIIYSIMVSIYSIQFKDTKCTIKNEYKHLEWEWNSMKYRGVIYLTFLFMLVFLFYKGIPNQNYAIILAAISLISYLISFFIYRKERVIGALWCFFAAFTPVLWYIARKTNLI
jgi:hypothetical protein